ncbi:MAG: hypothetical protein NHB15_08205 [Methanosarcina barkeri]|nr:hypothetical protein [Methanosarcina sp. ERenArc_MAG2]
MDQNTYLMKLSVYEDEDLKTIIEECCKKHGAYFIPLFDNRFAILTNKKEVSYGVEDGSYFKDYSVKTFIDIYQCVKNQSNEKNLFLERKDQLIILESY